MRAYIGILRLPGVAVLLSAACVGRLSPAVSDLAILLYVADETGSFAVAGAAAGAFAFATGVGSPLIGRAADRSGIAVMAGFAVAHLAALTSVWLVGMTSAPGAALVVAAALAGATYPPTGAALRARWPALIAGAPQRLETAYALDSVATSLAFMTGPLITAALVATVGAGIGLPVAGSAALLATLVFVGAAPATTRERRARNLLGALGSAGMRTVILAVVTAGFAVGTVQVAIAAFCSERGNAALAGVLIGLWSLSTSLVSLVYGLRPPRMSLRTANMLATIGLGVATLPIALASSPLAMAVLLLVSGGPYGPMFVTANQLVGTVAPAGTSTEAYSWVITSMVAGTAAGAALSGVAVEASSWQIAVLAGGVVGCAGGAILWVRRATLSPLHSAPLL